MTTAVADAAMRGLTKDGTIFKVPMETVRLIEKQLSELKGSPEFSAEVEALIKLAYVLEQKRSSPEACGAILGVVKRVAGIKPPTIAPATAGGWGRK